MSLLENAARLQVLDATLAAEPIPWPGLGGAALPLAALCGALRADDWLFLDPRSASAAWLRGMPLEALVAQALGTAGAAHAGHASPAEVTWKDGHVVSSGSLLGTHLLHAGGVAQAMAARQRDTVALAVFGPAAVATGDAHCAFNFAGVYRQPVVFAYLASDDAATRLSGGAFVDRADAYGIGAEAADGADPAALVAACAAAVRRARSGEPCLLEIRAPLRDVAVEPGLAARFGAEVRGAIQGARAQGAPAPQTLFESVTAAPSPSLLEQAR